MAAPFSEAVKAALAGRSVMLRRFLHMQFDDGDVRVWDGPGVLRAGGFTWTGYGEWLSISDVEAPAGGLATNLTVSLSGVPQQSEHGGERVNLVARIVDRAAFAKGRPLTYRFGVYDLDSGALLDRLYVAWKGVMDQPKIDLSAETATISIAAETVFARRAIAAYAYYSTADQAEFYPADKGLRFVPSMVSSDLKWPPG